MASDAIAMPVPLKSEQLPKVLLEWHVALPPFRTCKGVPMISPEFVPLTLLVCFVILPTAVPSSPDGAKTKDRMLGKCWKVCPTFTNR